MRGRTFIEEFTVFFFKKLYMNMLKKFRDSFAVIAKCCVKITFAM